MNKEALITVGLETLTPLWTGDAFSKTAEIKASSILGTIRWWYEIICRSLGMRVCDGKHLEKCNLKRKEFLKDLIKDRPIDEALDNQNICPVCRLFGCNGWAGKIKLIIDENIKEDIGEIVVGTRRNDKGRRPIEGKIFNKENSLKLLFIPVKELNEKEIELLILTIRIISDNAALGGRTAQGNGIVRLLFNETPKRRNVITKDDIKETAKSWKYPTLDNTFFLKVRLEFSENISCIIDKNKFWTGSNRSSNSKSWDRIWTKHRFIPIGFHIRDTIRRVEQNENLRHELFGKVKKDGEGSKIFVSHGYKIHNNTVEVRIWGYYKNEKIQELVSKIKIQLKAENLKNNIFINNYCKNLNVNIHSDFTGKQLFKKYLEEGKDEI